MPGGSPADPILVDADPYSDTWTPATPDEVRWYAFTPVLNGVVGARVLAAGVSFVPTLSVWGGDVSALEPYLDALSSTTQLPIGGLTDNGAGSPLNLPAFAGVPILFKIEGAGGSDPVVDDATFTFEIGPRGSLPVGSVLIPGDLRGLLNGESGGPYVQFPSAVFDPVTGEVLHLRADLVESESGAILPSGILALTNKAPGARTVVLYDTANDFAEVATVASPIDDGGDVVNAQYVTRYGDDGFLVAGWDAVGEVYKAFFLSDAGVVGDLFDLPADASLAEGGFAADQLLQRLYYPYFRSTSIDDFRGIAIVDLSTSAYAYDSDLAAAPTPPAGVTRMQLNARDALFVNGASEVFAAWLPFGYFESHFPSASPTDIEPVVYRYTDAGCVLSTYVVELPGPLIGTLQDNLDRLSRGADDTEFLLWTQYEPNPGDIRGLSGYSVLTRRQVSDGATLSTSPPLYHFETGRGPTAADVPDAPLFGHAQSCPAVVLLSGIAASPVAVLTVHKTVEDGDSTGTPFEITVTPQSGEPFAFSLIDGEEQSFEVPPGVFAVEETVPDGWELVDTAVSNDDEASAITVEDGQSVTVTFTNRALVVVGPGTLIIEKILDGEDPGDGTQLFAVVVGGGLTPNTFSLKNGDSYMFEDVTPGDGYSVREVVPRGWRQVSAVVSNGSPIDNITVAAGETVTVTLTNTPEACECCVATKLDIINQALLKLGVTQLVLDLAEATPEGQTGSRVYEPALRECLRLHPWAFATKYAGAPDPVDGYMNLVAGTETVPAQANSDGATEWQYAYRYPLDCLFARRIVTDKGRTFDREPIPFRVGRSWSEDASQDVLYVYTNQPDAVLEYTAIVECSEDFFDALFEDALSWKVAEKLAPSFSRNKLTAADCRGLFEATLDQARARTEREQQQEKDGGAEWIDNRG